MIVQLSYRARDIIRKMLLYFFSLLVSGVFIFPILWLVLSSFKPTKELISWPPTLFPRQFSIEHYIDLFVRAPEFSRTILNSVIVAGSVTLITVVIASLAAYSLTRFRFRPGFKSGFKQFMYICYMFPPVMLALSFLIIFVPLHLANTLQGLILAHLTITAPFATLVLLPFFESIPTELDEVAYIDGASKLRTFLSIILPAARPGVTSVGLFSFVMSWNNYTYAIFIITKQDLRVATQAVVGFLYQELHLPWVLVLPAIILTTLPTFIVFLALEEKLLKGFGVL